jgi:hypothetical protein
VPAFQGYDTAAQHHQGVAKITEGKDGLVIWARNQWMHALCNSYARFETYHVLEAVVYVRIIVYCAKRIKVQLYTRVQDLSVRSAPENSSESRMRRLVSLQKRRQRK